MAYRLVFSAVRTAGKPVQLEEVVLRSQSGAVLVPQSVTNPGGASPEGQPASDAFDRNSAAAASKWIDLNFPLAQSSTLEFVLPPDAPPLASYELVTANDNRGRDPTAWRLLRRDSSGWRLIDEQRDVLPPDGRFLSSPGLSPPILAAAAHSPTALPSTAAPLQPPLPLSPSPPSPLPLSSSSPPSARLADASRHALPPPSHPLSHVVLCSNACLRSNDGECADGGYLSTSEACAHGSDCHDCGARWVLAAPPERQLRLSAVFACLLLLAVAAALSVAAVRRVRWRQSAGFAPLPRGAHEDERLSDGAPSEAPREEMESVAPPLAAAHPPDASQRGCIKQPQATGECRSHHGWTDALPEAVFGAGLHTAADFGCFGYDRSGSSEGNAIERWRL
ncbi:hypothetical protein AB1Y20_016727 [Prymnesium parvum]|uniref:Uncharacterized protein n=1 Tax=Prymnesium parvum TaxID=97485 RepID=A0AB34IBT0_PRYPA